MMTASLSLACSSSSVPGGGGGGGGEAGVSDVISAGDTGVAPADVPSTPTDRPVTPTDTGSTTADAGTTPGAGTAVTTFQFDLGRTGANRSETRLTVAAVRAGMTRDTAFAPRLDSTVYAQPLYLPQVRTAMGARDLLFVATQANTVYALDASSGATVWTAALGAPVPRSTQSCGNINEGTGVLGTPVIDPATGTLYAVSFNRQGSNNIWRLHALDVTNGQPRANYPADITAQANGGGLDGRTTQQRGALAFRDGRVFVPFGGLYGDCGIYHGWVIALGAADPSQQSAFATPGRGSGVWAPGGLSVDETGRVFIATGNSTPLGGHTPGSFGEYVIRLNGSALAFDGNDNAAYFSASNARALDLQDLDIGSVAPMLLPRSGGRRLVLQGGKAGVVAILDGDTLGGVATGNGTTGEGLTSARLFTGGNFGAPAAWSDGTTITAFVTGRGRSTCTITNGGVMALRVSADGSSANSAWCTANIANPSPPAVSSNGNNDAILWATGPGAPLYAYSVADGTVLWQSSGADNPPSVRQWTPVVVADGRVFVTGSNTVSMYRAR